MVVLEREIERVLTLLRNKIRERGFTQLEVQEALAWGRSYISQLLTKQKSLRVEQVLLILNVIGVDPGEFYAELYQLSPVDKMRSVEDYSDGRYRSASYNPSSIAEVSDPGMTGEFSRSFQELRSLLRGLVRLLVDKNLINVDELTTAVKACESGPILDDFDAGKGPLN
ncbi:MAG: helix-turn-helix transcriptional regulator [Acidobacteriota bacterium]